MFNELEYIKKIDEIEFYRFNPKPWKLYFTKYKCYNKITLFHWIRMFIEYCQGGYFVYYMIVNDEVVGYLCVSPGGRRLTCSDPQDITIGPIWIDPYKRGNAYGTKGINAVLNELGISYKYAYEFIKQTNTPSVRTVEKNNFEKIGCGVSRGLLRKIYRCDEGEYFIYRYKNLL